MDEFWLKSEFKMLQEIVFCSIFNVKMTHLPIHHHGDYIASPIVFILSDDIDDVWLISEIQNGHQYAV